jgi:short-subunit dehydrogenase
MKIAIITGASSGIGEEFVRQILRDSHSFAGSEPDEIWLFARRAHRLISLREELGPDKIRIFSTDLIEEDGIATLSHALEEAHPRISLLINCAGMGKYGDFTELSQDNVRKTILLNCSVLSQMVSVCLPYMLPLGKENGFRQGPRILNVSSSASFIPQPGFSVYAASKAYVTSFSQALSAELRPLGIGVTAVCPGPVATNFIAIASGKPDGAPKGIKSLFVVQPQGLVKAALRAVKRGKRLYVHTFSQKFLYLISRFTPTGLMLFIIRKTA